MGKGSTTINAPAAPTYQESTRDILKTQIEMAPPLFQAEAQYQPLYNALSAAQQAFQVQQGLNIASQAYPQIAAIEADYNAANRAAELGQLQTALPEYQQAFDALTPGYAESVASTGQLAQSAMAQALNRPQFNSFQNTIRDPYGSPIAAQQPQMAPVSYAAPQQSFPSQLQRPVAQPAPQAQPVPKIQYDKGTDAQFKEFMGGMQERLSVPPAPKDPGPAIAPVRTGRGWISNKTAIDTRNAEIAKYQTDLAAYKESEVKRQPGVDQYLSNFDPAAAFAPQQPVAAQQPVSSTKAKLDAARAAQAQAKADRAASLQSILDARKVKETEVMANIQAVQAARDGTAPMVSAAGGPAMPGISTGQMQGPALPSGPLGAGGTPVSAAGGSAMQGPGMPLQSQMLQQPQAPQQMQSGQMPLRQAYSGLQETPAGGYVNAVQGFAPTNVALGAGMPQEAGFLNQVQSAQAAAARAGAVPTAANMAGVAGPTLASNIQNLDQNAVNQYIAAMPGMGQYANMLAQQSQAELAAGRSLTAEEQRIADQTARSAYAARGTALGLQSVNAEILNRADVSNQRYQQRLQNAAQAAGTIQGIYQPALQQSLQRQQLGIDYGLGVQQQAFGQAQAKDVMAQQLQAQRYAQAMGTQGTSFEQAMGRENLGQDIQQKRYSQLMGQQQLMQGAQEQAYTQAMGREQLGANTQQAAFQQALQRGTAEQQAYAAATQAQAAQAGLGASAMSQLRASQAPAIQAFYKQPILQGQENQAQNLALAMQQQSGPQLFNPESQVGMGSIYGAYNTQANLAAAQAQANASVQAGKMAMIGNIAGSFGSAVGFGVAKCWVAREVYGEHNPTWKIFREWLIEDAPKWFHDLYCQYGERFAKFISNKPKLKQLVKAWMDSRIS